MKLQRVEVSGFRSFRDLETFDFDESPCLVNLTGINEDEPALGANGAGKSSLWEAILWCLYGSSSTGLRGPEIASWGQGRGVYVLVKVDGHSVVRTWGPNTLLLDAEEARQGEVDAVVGLTREQFLFCTYMAQHAETFLDLGATAKTDLLASILSLDKWLGYSEEAATRAKTIGAEVRAVQVSLAALDASMRTLEATDYALLHEEWVRKKRTALADIAEEVEALTARMAKDNPLSALSLSVVALRKAWERADADADGHRDAVVRQGELVRTLEEQFAAAAKARKQGVCETCGQRLPHSHGSRGQEQTAQEKLDKARGILSGMQKVDKELLHHVRANAEELRVKRQALQEAEAQEVQDKRNVEQFEEARKKLRASRSPYEGLIVDKAQSLQRMKRERKGFEDDLVDAEARYEVTVQWVQGFKDVRLFLVAEALLQLEVEVNSALAQLGLTDWSVRFAPDSETKAGAVKRGFSVTVLSPNNERPVPWQVWSGGEAQRLRIAASMGLSNLISAYTGYRAFVEVWDEPTTGMSAQGIDALLAAMRERATHNNKQLWVVDHRAFDSGFFQQTVTAVKCDGTTMLRRIEDGRQQGE